MTRQETIIEVKRVLHNLMPSSVLANVAIDTLVNLANSPHAFIIEVSDEITSIVTGTNKKKFRFPYEFEVTDIKASLNVASDGIDNLVIVDINETGASILSTKLTFDPSEKTTKTAGAIAAFGSVELSGGRARSIDGITVNGIQIMSGAEVFDTDLNTTAQNVVDNINAFTSSPEYTASRIGAVITITRLVTGLNTFAILSSATTITTIDVNMHGGSNGIKVISDTIFAEDAELSIDIDDDGDGNAKGLKIYIIGFPVII